MTETVHILIRSYIYSKNVAILPLFLRMVPNVNQRKDGSIPLPMIIHFIFLILFICFIQMPRNIVPATCCPTAYRFACQLHSLAVSCLEESR